MTPEELTALMDRATRPRRTVPVVLDGDLRQQIEELAYELEQIETEQKENDRRLASKRKAPPARLAEAEAELDQLAGAAEKVTVHLVVEGLPGTPFEALKTEHKPREDHAGDKAWGLNLATIRDPLLRAALIGRRETADSEQILPLAEGFVDWLLGWGTSYQLDKLNLAALNASRGDDAVPLPQRRSATLNSDAE